MKKQSPFDAVVFAGGGSRCFWQVGFWGVVAPELGIRPTQVAGTSAGAAMACMIFSGSIDRGVNHFKRITGLNERNFYPLNPLRGRMAFPHFAMYRETLLEALDQDAFERLKGSDTDIRILLTRPPRLLGPRSATFIGLTSYMLEKHTVNPVHPKLACRMGFTWEAVSVRDCATPGDVANLVLQASCTPPMVPIQHRDGRPVLDGGIMDNVPVSAIDEGKGRTLLLVTRAYRDDRYPKDKNRLYVGPSRPVSIGKWDYTSPEKVQDTLDLGRRDGEAFLKEWRAGL